MGLTQDEKDLFDAIVGGAEAESTVLLEATLHGERVPVIAAVTVSDETGYVLAPLAVIVTESEFFASLTPSDEEFDVTRRDDPAIAEREASAREAA